MKTNRKEQTSPPGNLARAAIALTAFSLGACSTHVSHSTPAASSVQRTGQVQLTSSDTNIVGDIVIRHDAKNFRAEISKGPGVPLLTLSAEFGPGKSKLLPERHTIVVKASGPLAK